MAENKTEKNINLQPQSLEAEEAVLGAMMIDNQCVDEVLNIIKPQVFFKSAHKQIFEAIESIYHRTEDIDLITVSEELKKQKKLKNNLKIMNFISTVQPSYFHSGRSHEKY